MSRGLNNWTYNDVARFLRARGFEVKRQHGSHHYFAGIVDGKNKVVTVAFHGNKPIDIRDIKSMVRQSGISQEEWGAG